MQIINEQTRKYKTFHVPRNCTSVTGQGQWYWRMCFIDHHASHVHSGVKFSYTQCPQQRTDFIPPGLSATWYIDIHSTSIETSIATLNSTFKSSSFTYMHLRVNMPTGTTWNYIYYPLTTNLEIHGATPNSRDSCFWPYPSPARSSAGHFGAQLHPCSASNIEF